MYVPHNTPYNLRDNYRVEIPPFNTVTYGKRSLRYEGSTLYNKLPESIKLIDNVVGFSNAVRKWTGPNCSCGECIICRSNVLK